MATFAGRYDEILLKRDTSQDNSVVRIVSGASVQVLESDGVTVADLFTDRTKGTPADNPTAPDSDGNLQFWVVPGNYVLKVSVGGDLVRTDPVSVLPDAEDSVLDEAASAAHTAASTGVHAITGTVGVGKVLATNVAGTAPLWQSKDVFDVRDYGAVGDGVTDDTTAIQAALTAAGVSGGVVTMPPGTFLVGSEIVIPDLCSLEGAGRWTTIIRLTSSGATVSWGPVTAGTDTPIRLPGYLAHFQIDGQGIADVCLTIGALASPTGWDVELRDAAVDCLRLNQVQNGEFFRWQTSEAVRYCINFDYGANGNNFFGAYVTKAETALVNFGGAVPSGIGSANGPGRNVFWGSYLERPEAAMTSLVRAESGRQNSFVDTRINADVPTTLDPLPLVDIVAAGAAGTVQQLTFTRCRFAGNGTTDVYPLKQVSGTPVAFDRCVFASTLDTATVWMQTTVDVWMFANNFEASPTTMHTTGDEKILAVPGSVGRVMLPDGTVSNPALAFGSDPTVGHQLFATGVLALVAAGKVWRVDGANGGRLVNTGFDTATTQAMVQRVTGDTQDRFARLANGQMRWGPGDAAADVTMERTASGTIGVGAGHAIRTGRAATGSRPSAPTVGAGAMFYDTTLGKPVWSDGTNWADGGTDEERAARIAADAAALVAANTAYVTGLLKNVDPATGVAATDLANLQAALDAVGSSPFYSGVSLRTNGVNYQINDTLTPSSNTLIRGWGGAVIEQTASLTTSILLDTLDDVTIHGVRMVGLGTDYVNTTGVHAATAIYIDGCNRITIDGCYLSNHAGNSIQVWDSDDTKITHNTLVGPGVAEITSNDQYGTGVRIMPSVRGLLIGGNDISGSAQGIGAGAHGASDVQIKGNVIHDIPGQHGIYLGAVVGLTISDNIIRDCEYHNIKVQQSASATADATGIIVTDNVLIGAANSHALIFTSTEDPSTYKIRDFVVSNNTISGASLDAISLGWCEGGVVTNNTTNGSRHGVIMSDCENVRVDGNVIRDARRDGVLIQDVSDASISHNTILNPSSDNDTEEYGIAANGACPNLSLVSNVIRDTNSNMRFGILIKSGMTDQATSRVIDNVVTGATDYGGRFNAAAIAEFRGNSFSGGSGAVFDKPTSGDGFEVVGKVLSGAGLGVGNSASATTLGTLSKKMEVFDVAGASLGFVPIYTTIT